MPAMRDAGCLHADCPTIGGPTIGEIAEAAVVPDGEIGRDPKNPIAATGGLVVLRGNLAPEGALLKVAGLKRSAHTGPARVFDGEEAAVAAVRARAYAAGALPPALAKYARLVDPAYSGAVTH